MASDGLVGQTAGSPPSDSVSLPVHWSIAFGDHRRDDSDLSWATSSSVRLCSQGLALRDASLLFFLTIEGAPL